MKAVQAQTVLPHNVTEPDRVWQSDLGSRGVQRGNSLSAFWGLRIELDRHRLSTPLGLAKCAYKVEAGAEWIFSAPIFCELG